MKSKILYGIIPALLLIVWSASPVLCASTLTPKETSLLEGFSVTFSFKDPNYASQTLNYTVLDDSGSVIESGSFTTDANGEGSFTVTFSDAGEYRVQVKSGSTVLATAYVHVIDVIEQIFPVIMVVILITVVFGVVEMIQREVRF